MKKLLMTGLVLLAVVLGSPVFALQEGQVAPAIALRDSNRSFFYLSSYVGPKKKEKCKGVIINFFSSTCGPCKNELPVLDSLVDEFEKQGIRVVIIGYKESFDKFDDMLEKLKVEKPIILADPYGKIGEQYGVYGLPLTVFVGGDGKVKDIVTGEVNDIVKVLREKAGRLVR